MASRAGAEPDALRVTGVSIRDGGCSASHGDHFMTFGTCARGDAILRFRHALGLDFREPAARDDGPNVHRGRHRRSFSANLSNPGPRSRTSQRRNHAVNCSLPFKDPQDFDDAMRHLSRQHPTPRSDRYTFLGREAPPTVKLSLWRHAQFNAIHGLFRIAEGVYQVRGSAPEA